MPAKRMDGQIPERGAVPHERVELDWPADVALCSDQFALDDLISRSSPCHEERTADVAAGVRDDRIQVHGRLLGEKPPPNEGGIGWKQLSNALNQFANHRILMRNHRQRKAVVENSQFSEPVFKFVDLLCKHFAG